MSFWRRDWGFRVPPQGGRISKHGSGLNCNEACMKTSVLPRILSA